MPYSKIIMGGGYTYNYKLIIMKFSFQIVFTPTDLARNGHNAVPCKFHTSHCTCDSLIDVFKNELDKTFFGIEFSDTENQVINRRIYQIKNTSQNKI